jgi:HPt (histidine-containing phosphotransfer) domain-containing protein
MNDRSNRGILAGQLARLGPVFRQRLGRDREQLETLLTTVAGSGDGAPAALRELEVCAHKLHGTAAMFGYESLGAAAGRLEAEAHASLSAGVPHDETGARLQPLLDALDREIATATAGDAPAQ